MFSTEHRLAEQASLDASVELSRGERERAWSLYSDAANHEVAALRTIAREKVRTYSAIALSAVALLFKAKRYADCAAEARGALDAPVLEEYARTEIDEILADATTVLLSKRARDGVAAVGMRFPGFSAVFDENLSAMLRDPRRYPRHWKTDDLFRVATMRHAGAAWRLTFELGDRLVIHSIELAEGEFAGATRHQAGPMLMH